MFVLAPLAGMQQSARGEFALVDPIRVQTATPEWHAASQDKKGEWQRYTVNDEAKTNLYVFQALGSKLGIDAAKTIRFIPAIKDGRFVSMWIQLEYNFNLY